MAGDRGYRKYDRSGRAVLLALLRRPAGATSGELASELAYARGTVTVVYRLARYDGLIEPGVGRFVWRLTAAGRKFAGSFT